jgi:hypothetical protein
MLLERIVGVLRLDVATYEEIEADETATSQAALVVAAVAIVGGIFVGIIGAIGEDSTFVGSFLRHLLSVFFGWATWSVATYYVGTSLFEGKSTINQMLRVLGFAQVPGLLAIVPFCGTFVGWIWTMVCSFIAIRQGLDLDNSKALMTAVISFFIVLIVNLAIGAVLLATNISANLLSGLF